MNKIEAIIKRLELEPHPEGGYFRETYRSAGEIDASGLGSGFSGKRNYSTCIYFLLTSDSFSAFHRINQDEIWHFYDGSPIRLHTISESGEHKTFVIGRNIHLGEVLQLIVPAGDWFAAEVMDNDSFSLVGCTVSPGFSFEDFELPEREALIDKFLNHRGADNKIHAGLNFSIIVLEF